MTKIKRWRKMTWVVWLWCLLIIVWAIGGASEADCGSETDELSRSACEAGAGIGVAFILFVGFFGFVFLRPHLVHDTATAPPVPALRRGREERPD